MKILREILVYAALVLALGFAARQLEGFSVGRIDSSDVPSFLDFLK